MKKTLSLILALIMVSVSLIGCTNKTEIPEGALSIDEAYKFIDELAPKTEEDNVFVMSVEGNDVTLSEYKNYYISLYPFYEVYKNGETEEMKEELIKESDYYAKSNIAILNLAEKNGVFFTKEDIDFVVDNFNAITEMYGKEANIVIPEATNSTSNFYAKNMLLFSLSSKLYTHLYGVNGAMYENIKEQTLESFNANDIVRAKHILIKFPTNEDNSDVTDEQKATAYAKATEVLEKAHSGQDFDELVAQYNEDTGMPETGYYFGRNEMVKSFEDATYALTEGNISDIIESPYGYHIIKRLPLDDDNIVNTEEYSNIAGTEYTEIIESEVDKIEAKKYDDFDKLIEPMYETINLYLDEIKQYYSEIENHDQNDGTTQTAE